MRMTEFFSLVSGECNFYNYDKITHLDLSDYHLKSIVSEAKKNNKQLRSKSNPDATDSECA